MSSTALQTAEFDIIYEEGISRGSILDLAAKDIINKVEPGILTAIYVGTGGRMQAFLKENEALRTK